MMIAFGKSFSVGEGSNDQNRAEVLPVLQELPFEFLGKTGHFVVHPRLVWGEISVMVYQDFWRQ
jgi:hypothetical protein